MKGVCLMFVEGALDGKGRDKSALWEGATVKLRSLGKAQTWKGCASLLLSLLRWVG